NNIDLAIVIDFFKNLFKHFSNSNTFQEGAALAYYSVFSILPMIMILIAIFGLLWGEQSVSGEIYQELKGILGDQGASQLQDLIKSQHQQHNSKITALIGFSTLALGATGMFNQLHTSFNNIWNIKSKPRNSFLFYLSKHAISFTIIVLLFLVITLSLSINSFLTKHSSASSNLFSLLIWELLIAYFLMAFLFALMFKFVGDAKVHWKVSLLGGLFTSLLFLIGKYLIGLYIGHSKISSTFGSASLLALLMVWVYYTSQIIFMGASFVKVFSKTVDLPIVPSKDGEVKIQD
ncbi:MAG: YihY/virulence factor BrkB family protein, partial [Bacteroidota bacterium]